VGYFFGADYQAILSVFRRDALVVAAISILVLAAYYVYKRNRT